jgi:hypothetical protein
MGLKKFLENLKKKAEDHLKEETDPAKIRQAKKAAAEKTFKRTTTVIKWAKKGMETYNDVSQKVEKVTDAAAEKTANLAEKAKPIADKIDNVAGAVGEKAKQAFDVVKDKVVQGVDAAGKKIEETREESAKKPSTGSGLLDFIAPAVPETDATKPKAKDEAPKEPPKAAPPAPPAP